MIYMHVPYNAASSTVFMQGTGDEEAHNVFVSRRQSIMSIKTLIPVLGNSNCQGKPKTVEEVAFS